MSILSILFLLINIRSKFSILRVHKVLLFMTVVICSVKENVCIGSGVQSLEL